MGVKIGMDVAASEFYTGTEDGRYDLDFKNPDSSEDDKLSPEALSDLYLEFVEKCKGKSERLRGEIQIVGDDLTVTNPKRVKKAIDTKACNALLLKVNQIGTVTESIEAVAMSKKAGWG